MLKSTDARRGQRDEYYRIIKSFPSGDAAVQ